MGIDSIGKIGGSASQWPSGADGAQTVSGAATSTIEKGQQVTDKFSVSAEKPISTDKIEGGQQTQQTSVPAQVSNADAVSQSSPLGMLQAGKIDVNEYMQMRVQEATEHLVGLVNGEKLQVIRAELHNMLQQDPALVKLMRRVK